MKTNVILSVILIVFASSANACVSVIDRGRIGVNLVKIENGCNFLVRIGRTGYNSPIAWLEPGQTAWVTKTWRVLNN